MLEGPCRVRIGEIKGPAGLDFPAWDRYRKNHLILDFDKKK